MSIGQELAANSSQTKVPGDCPDPGSVYEGPNSFPPKIYQFGCNNMSDVICDGCIFTTKLGEFQKTFFFKLQKNGRFKFGEKAGI